MHEGNYQQLFYKTVISVAVTSNVLSNFLIVLPHVYYALYRSGTYIITNGSLLTACLNIFLLLR